jgi:serine/threonine protein kinase
MMRCLRLLQNGTPNYMSPEVAYNGIHYKSKRHISRKADIWSMGVILYLLIYGRCPFDEYKDKESKARAIIDPTEDIAFPPTNNPSADDMLRRCLTRDVAQRISLEVGRDPRCCRHECL